MLLSYIGRCNQPQPVFSSGSRHLEIFTTLQFTCLTNARLGFEHTHTHTHSHSLTLTHTHSHTRTHSHILTITYTPLTSNKYMFLSRFIHKRPHVKYINTRRSIFIRKHSLRLILTTSEENIAAKLQRLHETRGFTFELLNDVS